MVFLIHKTNNNITKKEFLGRNNRIDLLVQLPVA